MIDSGLELIGAMGMAAMVFLCGFIVGYWAKWGRGER